MEYVLTTNGLCKQYRNFKALNGLSMHVPKGAIYGFVGKNGAGKTTLIRLICGLQEPTSGEYAIYGIHNKEKDILKSRRRMGAIVETPSIYMNMTAEENMQEQYRILGMPSFGGIRQILELVGLEDTGRKKAKNFSLGMRQRLGIAVALAGDPDFLVLDEPANGLDPPGNCGDAGADLKAEPGKTDHGTGVQPHIRRAFQVGHPLRFCGRRAYGKGNQRGGIGKCLQEMYTCGSDGFKGSFQCTG